jgi:hypothetical protein
MVETVIIKDCLYRALKMYANYREKEIYDCLHCKKDELNLQCKYYLELKSLKMKK